MAKDDYEQRAEWEVRLQGMDPEGYKKITSDPAWMYLNEPTKLRNLIQAVADAGNKALVDTQGIPGINAPGSIRYSRSEAGGTSDDPSLTNYIPINKGQIDEYKRRMDEVEGKYNKSAIDYIAAENKRIGEMNAVRDYNNAVGWGQVPGVFPKTYEDLAKAYAGTGATLNPMTGSVSRAAGKAPMLPPIKPEGIPIPEEKWMDAWGRDAVAVAKTIPTPRTPGGVEPAPNYGTWKTWYWDTAAAPPRWRMYDRDDWGNFNGFMSGLYADSGQIKQSAKENINAIFKPAADIKKDKGWKTESGVTGTVFAMGRQQILEDIAKGGEIAKYFYNDNGKLAGKSHLLTKYVKKKDGAGKDYWVLEYTNEAKDVIDSIAEKLKTYISNNYSKAPNVTKNKDNADPSKTIDYKGDSPNVTSAMAWAMAEYLVKTSTGVPKVKMYGSTPYIDPSTGNILYEVKDLKTGKISYEPPTYDNFGIPHPPATTKDKKTMYENITPWME